MRLLAQEGRLLVVNQVLLEDYLLGVLPAEMPQGFP
ncbi:SpoIID/LytB domain-containing protein, partial [Acinetobacter baumannii]